MRTKRSPQAFASKRQWRPDTAMPAGRPMLAPPGRSVRKTDKPPGKGPFLHLAEGRLSGLDSQDRSPLDTCLRRPILISQQLHHASFTVCDLEAARRFYGGVLGLEEIERPAMGIDGAWYRVGDSQVHLIVTPAGVDVGTRPPQLNPLACHTAFAIDDYVKVRDALRAKGVEVLETNPKVGQMWVRDPDGNILEFIVPRRT
ncbi:MAG: hypothetical protein E2O73_02480 [Deltaproteobacteria bacterium]|nr:MAG: hypothetical protein E2O73_02480 [Deltaproteobacteria bacterium]TDJ08409.1 MAG: hypothetical protein E2O71_04750 [Deltaproteobacteria bacterium]